MNTYQAEHEQIQSAIRSTSIYGLEICRLLFSFNHEICEDSSVTSTVSTNCQDTIYYNIKFLRSLSSSELLFVLAHEIYHCILSHVSRGSKKKFDIWNAACDYYINDKLIKDQIGTMPPNCLYKKAYSKLTPEQIYKILDRDQSTDKNFDDHFPKDIGSSSSQSQDYTISEALDDIIKGSSMSGSSFYKSIKNYKIPKKQETNVDWRKILKGSIKDMGSSRFTYNRPNKKNSDIIFPKFHNDNNRYDMYLALDCSGSVSNAEFSKFLSEIFSILKLRKVNKLHIYLFDTQIIFQKTIKINSSGALKKAINTVHSLNNCGGGTDYACIFKSIKKKPKDYLFIFTDGYPGGSWGEDQPNLYYLITTKVISPIGKTIHLT